MRGPLRRCGSAPVGRCIPSGGRAHGCARGGPRATTLSRIPSASRAPRRWVWAYASGVSTSSIVALAAAIESALPNSVPPIATMSKRSPSGPLNCVRNTAASSRMPQAANGTPAAIDLPAVTKSGSRLHCAVSPPGPTTCVWVSSYASSVPASRVRRAGPRGTPPRAGSTRRCSSWRARRARARCRPARALSRPRSRSLNGTRTVCSVTSAGRPCSSGTSVPSGPSATNA